MMSLRKSTLYDYENFLTEYDGTPEVADSMHLSPHAMELRLTKLKLSAEPLCDSERQMIMDYYPLIGDALVYLLPNRTVAELRRCADEQDCHDHT